MRNLLEEAAKVLEKDTEALFREICWVKKTGGKRTDALWSGYATELFIPDFVEASCLQIVLGTTGKLQGEES